MTALLLKLPWQNIRNIVLAPMSRKLVIDGKKPRVKVTNWQRAAALNRERVNRHERRVRERKDFCTVEYGAAMLDKLVRLGLLADKKSADRTAVGEAVGKLWTQVDPDRPIK